MSTQFTQKPWDKIYTPWRGGRRTASATFNAPLKWNKRPWVCRDIGPVEYACCRYCHTMRVLWGTLGDPFDPAVPVELLVDALYVVRRCDQLDWWIVTKRPERAHDWHGALYTLPPNVRLGVSISDQPTADKLIPELLRVPAASRFLLIEPLLAPLKLKIYLDKLQSEYGSVKQPKAIQYVIIGGETGRNARPCNIAWVRDIIAQCGRVGTKCYVKQVGSRPYDSADRHHGALPFLQDTGGIKSRTGSDPAEWPEDLKVREI